MYVALSLSIFFPNVVNGFIIVHENSKNWKRILGKNPIVLGPYSNLQHAKDVLNSIPETSSRCIFEMIDCVIQSDPHKINGIEQSSSNGFQKYWAGWTMINAMLAIAKEHINSRICKKGQNNL